MALAVIHKGEVEKAAVYGSANLEWNQPDTRMSPFWLDSLMKLFTAVGVMQLQEQGKLQLEDPIAKYLPKTPAAWRGGFALLHNALTLFAESFFAAILQFRGSVSIGLHMSGGSAAFKGGQAGADYPVYPDDDLSVIFFTNLECSTWIDSFSANEIAHFFAPEIQQLSALRPQSDPDPPRTKKFHQALKDIASGVSTSPLITQSMNASLAPDLRSETKQLIAAMSSLEFLSCENASVSDP